MEKPEASDKQYKYEVKVKSKVFPELYHTVKVNLYCYEKLKKEESFESSATNSSKKKN